MISVLKAAFAPYSESKAREKLDAALAKAQVAVHKPAAPDDPMDQLGAEVAKMAFDHYAKRKDDLLKQHRQNWEDNRQLARAMLWGACVNFLSVAASIIVIIAALKGKL